LNAELVVSTPGTTGEIETTGTTGKPFPKVHVIVTGQSVTNEIPFVVHLATTIEVGSFIVEAFVVDTSIDVVAEIISASQMYELVGSTLIQYWELQIFPGQVCELDGIYTLLFQTNFTTPFNITKNIMLDSQDYCGDIITSPMEASAKAFRDSQRNISSSEFRFNDVAYFQVRSKFTILK
jgi:hypothetical protein